MPRRRGLPSFRALAQTPEGSPEPKFWTRVFGLGAKREYTDVGRPDY